jgi:tetratricopeptide (TPR) repeat protein
VLVVYMGAAFVALQVVEQIVESAGFPDWVRAYSLVLLTLGLPIVLITAAIQGRRLSAPMGGGDPADGSAPTSSPAGSLSGFRRWFTWRNTVLAGFAGVLVIVSATAAYVVMRAAGVGPAGTLQAKGSIVEGARVVLADFESADPDLGSVVTNTLRIDLLQSPFLAVLESSELEDGLERMELEQNARITPEVARELATRDGFDAVIEGEVGPLGDGYVLTARILGGEDWTSLAAFRSTARSEDDLIDAIEDLSRDIRDKSGESLRSARGGPALRAVTTSSMEALKAYNRGHEAYLAGEEQASLEWFERAVAIDPEFATAHRRVGAQLSNMGIRRDDMIRAASRAYEMRHRLTELERLLAEADYHTRVVVNIPAAIRAWEAMIELAPGARITRNARNNLAVWYLRTGRLQESENLYVDLVAERPYRSGFGTLVMTSLALGDVDRAVGWLDAGEESMPELSHSWEDDRVKLAWALDDIPLARSLVTGFAERFAGSGNAGRRAEQNYLLHASEGRLEAAADAIDELGAGTVLEAVYRAFLLATAGDSVGAVGLLLEGWEATEEADPLNRPFVIAREMARFGGIEPAEAILEEWRREVPVESLSFFDQGGRLEIEAEIALARGSIEEAIALWETLEQGHWIRSGESAYGLGRAYEAAGEAARAVAEYERHLLPFFQYETHDVPFFRADVRRRLARQHEMLGNVEEAASYYEQIIDRWQNGDASLQPHVDAARRSLNGLR